MNSDEQLQNGDSGNNQDEAKKLDLSQTIEIDGKQVSLEELQKGYLRQEDYTRKSQELANQRKELESKKQADTLDDDEKSALEFLRKNNFVTLEDLQKAQKNQESSVALDRMLDANPNLRQYEQAIRTIGKTTDMAWEDIVVNYGFSTKDKLSKAKSHDLMGSGFQQNTQQKGEKKISEMTDAEYEAFRKKNLTGRTFTLSKT